MKLFRRISTSLLLITFSVLLLGATALAIVTPVIGALLRWRRPVNAEPAKDDAATSS